MVRRGWKLDKASSIMFPTPRPHHAHRGTVEVSFKRPVKHYLEWPAEVPRPTAVSATEVNTQTQDDALATVEFFQDQLKELEANIMRCEAQVANDPSSLKERRGLIYQRQLKEEYNTQLLLLKKKLGP